MTTPVPLRPRWALALLAGLAVVTVTELVAGAFAYRETLDGQVWDELEASLDPALPLVVGTGWLDPVARRELEAAARPEVLAAPDLRNWPRFAVLSYGAQRDAMAELGQDGPGGVAPRLVSSQRFGPLELAVFEAAGAPVLLDDFSRDAVPQTQLENRDQARCRRSGTTTSCKRGGLELAHIESTIAQVGGRPRQCVQATMHDGVRLQLTATDFRFGAELYGHVGFPGMNARLRSDAPVTITLRRGEHVLSTFTFTDDQGWAPFATPTEPGRDSLVVEIQSAVRGTWGKDGYSRTPAHPVCFELRSFDAPSRLDRGAGA